MISDEPTVTIVIPTYNRSSMLMETLPAYLSQASVQEIIVVDDGSTDDTQKVVKDFATTHDSVRLLNVSHHKGTPTARNIGISSVQTPYIMFGEDDVLPSHNYVEQLLICAEKDHADVIAGRLIPIINGESLQDAINRSDQPGEIMDSRLVSASFSKSFEGHQLIPFVHAVALFRREVLGENPYDPGYIGNFYREETDPQIEISKRGGKIVLCSHTCCYAIIDPVKRTGGAWSRRNRFHYEWYSIVNNWRFLGKHNDYLNEVFGTRYSRIGRQYYFTLHRLQRAIAATMIEPLSPKIPTSIKRLIKNHRLG